MRQIEASEVKPGMTIRWETQMEIKRTTECNGVGGVLVSGDNRITEYLGSDAKITVVSEPAPPQPEEPTAFGAKVRVRKGRFVRLVEGDAGFRVWFEEVTESWWTWDDLCEMGTVTVIPDQGWTVPTDATEVPERIEEWPEDDTELRPYQWEDIDGCPWRSFGEDDWRFKTWEGGWSYPPRPTPLDGPWTRVTDA